MRGARRRPWAGGSRRTSRLHRPRRPRQGRARPPSPRATAGSIPIAALHRASDQAGASRSPDCRASRWGPQAEDSPRAHVVHRPRCAGGERIHATPTSNPARAEAARLVLAMGAERADEARTLAHRLYSPAERWRWADEAYACNILVTPWAQGRNDRGPHPGVAASGAGSARPEPAVISQGESTWRYRRASRSRFMFVPRHGSSASSYHRPSHCSTPRSTRKTRRLPPPFHPGYIR